MFENECFHAIKDLKIDISGSTLSADSSVQYSDALIAVLTHGRMDKGNVEIEKSSKGFVGYQLPPELSKPISKSNKEALGHHLIHAVARGMPWEKVLELNGSAKGERFDTATVPWVQTNGLGAIEWFDDVINRGFFNDDAVAGDALTVAKQIIKALPDDCKTQVIDIIQKKIDELNVNGSSTEQDIRALCFLYECIIERSTTEAVQATITRWVEAYKEIKTMQCSSTAQDQIDASMGRIALAGWTALDEPEVNKNKSLKESLETMMAISMANASDYESAPIRRKIEQNEPFRKAMLDNVDKIMSGDSSIDPSQKEQLLRVALSNGVSKDAVWTKNEGMYTTNLATATITFNAATGQFFVGKEVICSPPRELIEHTDVNTLLGNTPMFKECPIEVPFKKFQEIKNNGEPGLTFIWDSSQSMDNTLRIQQGERTYVSTETLINKLEKKDDLTNITNMIRQHEWVGWATSGDGPKNIHIQTRRGEPVATIRDNGTITKYKALGGSQPSEIFLVDMPPPPSIQVMFDAARMAPEDASKASAPVCWMGEETVDIEHIARGIKFKYDLTTFKVSIEDEQQHPWEVQPNDPWSKHMNAVVLGREEKRQLMLPMNESVVVVPLDASNTVAPTTNEQVLALWCNSHGLPKDMVAMGTLKGAVSEEYQGNVQSLINHILNTSIDNQWPYAMQLLKQLCDVSTNKLDNGQKKSLNHHLDRLSNVPMPPGQTAAMDWLREVVLKEAPKQKEVVDISKIFTFQSQLKANSFKSITERYRQPIRDRLNSDGDMSTAGTIQALTLLGAEFENEKRQLEHPLNAIKDSLGLPSIDAVVAHVLQAKSDMAWNRLAYRYLLAATETQHIQNILRECNKLDNNTDELPQDITDLLGYKRAYTDQLISKSPDESSVANALTMLFCEYQNKFRLRPEQSDKLEALLPKEDQEQSQRPFESMRTGFGKTSVFLFVLGLRYAKKRQPVVIVSTDELIEQNESDLAKLVPLNRIERFSLDAAIMGQITSQPGDKKVISDYLDTLINKIEHCKTHQSLIMMTPIVSAQLRCYHQLAIVNHQTDIEEKLANLIKRIGQGMALFDESDATYFPTKSFIVPTGATTKIDTAIQTQVIESIIEGKTTEGEGDDGQAQFNQALTAVRDQFKEGKRLGEHWGPSNNPDVAYMVPYRSTDTPDEGSQFGDPLFACAATVHYIKTKVTVGAPIPKALWWAVIQHLANDGLQPNTPDDGLNEIRKSVYSHSKV